MKKMLKKYLGITQLEQGLSQRIRGVEVNVKELTQMHIDVDLRGKSNRDPLWQVQKTGLCESLQRSGIGHHRAHLPPELAGRQGSV